VEEMKYSFRKLYPSTRFEEPELAKSRENCVV
jgi:hypothetical protein